MFYIYTINLSFVVRKLQVAILARSSREIYLKLFVSTVIPSYHEFASQFGLADFFRGENLLRKPSRSANIQLNEPATRPTRVVTEVTVDRQLPVKTPVT